MNSPFILPNNNFVTFGFEHLLVISLTILLGGALIYYAKWHMSSKAQHLTGNIIACILSLTIIVWTIVEYWVGIFDYKEDFPLYLCNFLALLMPIFSFTRSKVLYEIIVFWIFAGTLQAIITPDLYDGFPHYHFIKYWIVHNGLVLMMVYANQVYGFRPTLKSIGKSWLWLQALFVFFMLLNLAIGANYNYLNAKPIVPSILDYMGDWPYYILTVQLIVIPFFLLIYLPFWLTREKNQ